MGEKGDVDLEIAVTRRIGWSLDAVMVIGGDSDYLALKDYVIKHGKALAFWDSRIISPGS